MQNATTPCTAAMHHQYSIFNTMFPTLFATLTWLPTSDYTEISSTELFSQCWFTINKKSHKMFDVTDLL